VTYYPTQRDEVKSQVISSNNISAGKPNEKTKPRQLFWEKRFENIRPMDIDGEPFEHFQLPEQIKGTVKSVIRVFCLRIKISFFIRIKV
jgi:hypothetical protein